MKKKIYLPILFLFVLLVVCIEGNVAYASNSSCNHKLNPSGLEFVWSEDYSTCTTTMPCTVCGKKVEIPNDSYATYRKPTCTLDGGYICHESVTYGNNTYTSTPFVFKEYALGHNWDSGIVKTAAGCETTGTKLCTCTREGCKEQKEFLISALGHDCKKIATVQATCIQRAYYIYQCTRCDYQYTENDLTSDYAAHQFQKTKVVAPTCTKTGYTLYTCSVCGVTKQDDITRAAGHKYVDKRVEPTCKEAGYTYQECSVCKATVRTGTLTALGHDYQEQVISPTCTQQGYTLHQCTRCDSSYKDNYKKALGHNYKATVVVPTCGQQGYTLYTCTRCQSSYQDNWVSATEEHTWDSGKVTKNPTFSVTGTKSYTCTVCGAIKTETIAKLTKTALNHAVVTLSKTSVTYNGKAQKPSVTVKVGDVTISSSQYTITYSNNTKVGTAKVTIKAKNSSDCLTGSVTKTFKIIKAANPLTISPANKSYTATACKKKAQSFTIKTSKAQGTVSYKSSNTKYVTVKKGKVTIKKGTPRGTYKITVTAKGNGTYNSGSKVITITVK